MEHDKKYFLWGVNITSKMKLYLNNPAIDGLLTDFPGRLAQLSLKKSLNNIDNIDYSPKKINGKLYIKNSKKCPVTIFRGYGSQGENTGMMLNENAECTFTEIASVNGILWYCIGPNLWINGNSVSYSNVSNPIAPKTRIGLLLTKQRVPIYGDADCEIPTGRKLRSSSNSKWHCFAFYKNRDHLAYNLGDNQWIEAKYVKILQ